jgi:GT2 family glycosyltransferase
MPRFSVISIARDERELDGLRDHLSRQRFRDFEFVSSTKGSIPEAWNDAVARATGEFLVFTESDARPLQETWLAEIDALVGEGTVMKGLEITPTSLDLCNLVCDRRVFETMRFDETFPIGEDTELFARMRRSGIAIEQVRGFPVMHERTETWGKTRRRAFASGRLTAKILFLHGKANLDTVNTRNIGGEPINPVSNRLRIIAENVLFLAGVCVGAVRYLPLVLVRRA